MLCERKKSNIPPNADCPPVQPLSLSSSPPCSQPLADVMGKPACTHLDQYAYRFRSTNLNQIVQAALKLKHEDTDLQTVLEQAEDWLLRLKAMAEEVRMGGAALLLHPGGCCDWLVFLSARNSFPNLPPALSKSDSR